MGKKKRTKKNRPYYYSVLADIQALKKKKKNIPADRKGEEKERGEKACPAFSFTIFSRAIETHIERIALPEGKRKKRKTRNLVLFATKPSKPGWTLVCSTFHRVRY